MVFLYHRPLQADFLSKQREARICTYGSSTVRLSTEWSLKKSQLNRAMKLLWPERLGQYSARLTSMCSS